MMGDIKLIEKAVTIILDRVSLTDMLRASYVYLKNNPDKVEKVYKIALALKEMIEREFMGVSRQ
ncbi:MAG: hypothetical protein QXT64_07780 [Desulfurococcaceae archaeon]